MISFVYGFSLWNAMGLCPPRKITHPMPIILLGAEFWKNALNFDYMLECGMSQPQPSLDHDLDLGWLCF